MIYLQIELTYIQQIVFVCDKHFARHAKPRLVETLKDKSTEILPYPDIL